MNKLASLRQHMLDQIPDLNRDPDALLVFANKGRVVSTLSPSLSFEYRYQAELIFTDYSGHADTIMVPILLWVRLNQYELLKNEEPNGIDFEAEILNHETADISVKLDLTERVIVSMVNGARTIKHADEPPLDDLTGATGWAMYAGGTAVS